MSLLTIQQDRFQHAEKIITNMQRSVINSVLTQQIFSQFIGEDLEELKNRISDDRDYYDLVNLFGRISEPYRSMIINHFNSNYIPPNSIYATKIFSDIDNTTIENKTFAPVLYKDKDVVPGIRSILKYFSKCRTAVGFISARPKILERSSIDTVDRMFTKQLRFSFHTGDVSSITQYIIGKATLSESAVTNSYIQMAHAKYNNYLNLREIYPHCRFIFLGDDTQGDFYFAKLLVDHDPNNMAFIRQAVGTLIQPDIFYHPRIWFHTSYFELIYTLINDLIVDRTEISKLLQFEMLYQYDSLNYNSAEQIAKDKYYYNLIMGTGVPGVPSTYCSIKPKRSIRHKLSRAGYCDDVSPIGLATIPRKPINKVVGFLGNCRNIKERFICPKKNNIRPISYIHKILPHYDNTFY